MAYHEQFINAAKGNRETHKCPSCGQGTYCAMEAGKSGSACWCMSVPHNKQDSVYTQCTCKKCLTGSN